jgi:hypothetical protein
LVVELVVVLHLATLLELVVLVVDQKLSLGHRAV